MEQECQVPGAEWFVEYGKRRFKENLCGKLKPVAVEDLSATPLPALTALAAAVVVAVAAVAVRALIACWRPEGQVEGHAPLLA
mmetsp:Transcript_2555/g.5162  ORF Transcript_2555/g.5162 Transcript_2555/m.5162 type:complete len:83 (+) Transcript_2555:143-391(+)